MDNDGVVVERIETELTLLAKRQLVDLLMNEEQYENHDHLILCVSVLSDELVKWAEGGK